MILMERFVLSASFSSHDFVCVCVFILLICHCVCTCICVFYICVETGGRCWLAFLIALHLILWYHLSLNLDLTDSARLAGQRPLGIHLSLSPQPWSIITCYHMWVFEFGGSKFMSLCLHSECFTCWAILSAPPICLSRYVATERNTAFISKLSLFRPYICGHHDQDNFLFYYYY